MHSIEIKEKIYQFPDNENELTLGMYEQIQTIVISKDENGDFTYKEIIKIISTITSIEEEIILSSPIDFFNLLYDLTKWIFEFDLKKYPVKSSISINGTLFTYNPDSNILLKEWVDIDTILKDFPEEKKLSGILSVRLRKENEEYDSKFLEERITLFKSAKAVDVMPIINCFFLTENQSQNLLRTYSVGLEAARLQQETNDNLIENGVGFKPLSSWQKKILLKLNQSFKSQLLKCSTFYHTNLIKINSRNN